MSNSGSARKRAFNVFADSDEEDEDLQPTPSKAARLPSRTTQPAPTSTPSASFLRQTTTPSAAIPSHESTHEDDDDDDDLQATPVMLAAIPAPPASSSSRRSVTPIPATAPPPAISARDPGPAPRAASQPVSTTPTKQIARWRPDVTARGLDAEPAQSPPPAAADDDDDDDEPTPRAAAAGARALEPEAVAVDDDDVEAAETVDPSLVPHRSLHHVRIGMQRVMGVVAMVEPKYRKWLTTELFSRVLLTLKYVLLAKLKREEQSREKGTADICLGDTFQYAYSIHPTDVRQSLLNREPTTGLYTSYVVYHQTVRLLVEPRSVPSSRRAARSLADMWNKQQLKGSGAAAAGGTAGIEETTGGRWEVNLLTKEKSLKGLRVGAKWLRYSKAGCTITEVLEIKEDASAEDVVEVEEG
ncbi:hypothetical protein HDU96_008558 [Phlyctochytrium bullatum]|nr:hypothetical protein HDU96_008558 [Phlyctochytrium bullatum]